MDKKIGVLLIHGFAGTCKDMEPLKDFLEEHSFLVSCPTLKAHNTIVRDMLYTKYSDWIQDVESSYQILKKHCENIYVCGLSMGGLLAFALSAKHREINGIITLAPSFFVKDIKFKFSPISFLFPKLMFPVGKSIDDPETEGYKFVPAISGHQLYRLIRYTKKILKEITSPILIIQGGRDGMVYSPIAYIKKNVFSEIIKEFYVEDASHILTRIEKSPIIFKYILKFIQDRENGKLI